MDLIKPKMTQKSSSCIIYMQMFDMIILRLSATFDIPRMFPKLVKLHIAIFLN